MTESILLDDRFLMTVTGLLMLITILPVLVVTINSDRLSDEAYGHTMIFSSITGVLFILCLIFMHLINSERVYASDWKQLYSNDVKADITIDTFFDLHFKAGEATGVSLDELKRQLALDGKITATDTSNGKEVRSFTLAKDGIITTGEVDKTSRIVKVEYRPIEGKHNTAFGLKGPVYKIKTGGELRITVKGSEKSDELKKLFN